MKNKKFNSMIFLVLSLIIINLSEVICHKEWVHQYIIKEAYKLLYNEVGTIDPLYKVCGFDVNGNEIIGYDNYPNNWTHLYPLLRGAYVEDSDDILLGYGIWSGHANASSGHFWQADEGDYEYTEMPWPIYDAINAFDKARRYYFSNSSIHIEKYNIPVKVNIWPLKPKTIYTHSIWIRYKDVHLNYFIQNGDVILDDWDWNLGNLFWSMFKTSRPNLNNIDQYPNFGEISNKFVYGSGILGRICHLLADMSVPAHVHNDLHPCRRIFILPSPEGDVYELSMGHRYTNNGEPYTWEREYCDDVPDQTFYARMYYNQTTARQKSGIIWELFQINTMYDIFDRLHYLFYTLNQLSDCLPSKNIEKLNDVKVGNKNLVNPNNGVNPYLNFRYNYLNPSQDDVNVDEQADELFNYAIRATATFLYWMSWKLGWLNQDLLCRADNFYLQSERIFGHHIDKQFNNLEFKVEDISHTSNSGKIIAGRSVHPNPIIPEGEVIVDPSVNLTLSAEKEIALKDGFSALAGCYFHARILPVSCEGQPSIISSTISDCQEPKNNNWLEVETQIVLSPNPASNYLEIRLNKSINTSISLEVYNYFGAKVIDNSKSFVSNNNKFIRLDVSVLPSGIYFLTLKSGGEHFTKQFAVVK